MSKNIRILISVALLFAILAVPLVVFAAGGAGTADDPFITYSYLTQIFKTELKEELLASLSEEFKQQLWNEFFDKAKAAVIEDIRKNGLPAGETGAAAGYVVVQLKKGQRVSAKSVCEIILRSGEAVAFVTSAENISAGIGLSDCTDGNEILNGANLPLRHLMLIARADGRGFTVTSNEAYVMVRGEYEISG